MSSDKTLQISGTRHNFNKIEKSRFHVTQSTLFNGRTSRFAVRNTGPFCKL